MGLKVFITTKLVMEWAILILIIQTGSNVAKRKSAFHSNQQDKGNFLRASFIACIEIGLEIFVTLFSFA